STDGLRLTDEDGIVLEVNDAYCELVGQSREEIVGKYFTEVYADPKDWERMLASYRRNCGREERVGHYQARMTLRNGQTRDFEMSLSAIDSDVRKRIYLTNIRDVTERKQAEERRLKLERKMLDAQRLERLGSLAGGIAHRSEE